MRKIMNINDFNAEEFIAETQRKYGQAVTWNMIRGLTRMLRVAENSDYLEELNSPRCIVRMAVQPLTGNIIIKTIIFIKMLNCPFSTEILSLFFYYSKFRA